MRFAYCTLRADCILRALLATFSRFNFPLNVDLESYFALVLTPRPRLAEV
jgi:hypothetical protein